ncbi:hypothetical protein HNR23_004904 [Nocardiopsis mwathae]|uniref:Uncharacterized protein n=1 Tax=Nocardiopsis mwathae TaxID=1472723 RepID=A0A7X0D9A4_9ACTN|nr:hypothetical protein [Nocardiopsis mwathae]MBB6174844.1 hypothetical protein [Nocardiopsis mwathae]
MYEIAQGITEKLSPSDAFKAEQKISLLFAYWQTPEQEKGIEFKGKLQISLPPEDADRAKQFDAARRAARLDEAVTQDRLAFLRKTVLGDPYSAQLWWLHRNLEGAESETSWKAFDAFVRPLITHTAAEEDAEIRLAKIIATLVERIHENPDRLNTLAHIATATLTSMGWSDLADDMARLSPDSRSPSHDNSSFQSSAQESSAEID